MRRVGHALGQALAHVAAAALVVGLVMFAGALATNDAVANAWRWASDGRRWTDGADDSR